MLKSSEKTETNTYSLEISIEAEPFKEAILKVYNKQKKSIAIPGFRKGKVPLIMIEKYYGKGVFYEDALDLLYPDVVSDAITEAGIEAVSQPFDVEVKEIGENGVEMTMKITVKPEVEVKEYKGLKATAMDTNVTAADVKKELEAIRERNSRLVAVEDRPAKKDDVAIIDYEGSVDGVPFEGGKDEGHELTLGSGEFIPGFEDGVIGHNAGEEFDVNVKFPKEYHSEDLADKDAVFKVKLTAIKNKELPELNDDFAKDVSEFDTLAEYKKSLKAEIKSRKKDAADKDLESQILEQVVNGVEGEIPDVMYDNKVDEMVESFSQRIQQQGITMDVYLQYCGMDEKKLREQMRVDAVKQVKLMLAIEKIAAIEDIKVPKEDIEAEYKKMADMYKMEVEKIKGFVPAEDVSKDLINQKTVDFIIASAEVAEPEKKTKAKAEKKTEDKKSDAE